jgi:hypothetical protein
MRPPLGTNGLNRRYYGQASIGPLTVGANRAMPHADLPNILKVTSGKLRIRLAPPQK